MKIIPDLSKIKKNSRVAVALSGGKDSVCLLDVLNNVKTSVPFTLKIINIEHGIRGEASLKDTAFCKSLAEKYGLEFVSYSVNALNKAKTDSLNLEQAARVLRYDAFLKAIADNYCDAVAVAHHLLDETETVLFNLFRGSSLSGAIGIKPTNYEDKIIRPLLYVEKEAIEEYILTNKLSFVTDETNFDLSLTRNALRNNIIPEIKKLFPSADKAILRFSLLAGEDDEYLNRIAKNSLEIKQDEIKIPTTLEKPIFSRAALFALKQLGMEKDYEKRHIDALFALCTNISGKRTALKKGIYAVREHNYIVIKRRAAKTLSEIPFDLNSPIFSLANFKLSPSIYSEFLLKKQNELFFDAEQLPEGCVVRTKKVGDVFVKPDGSSVSLKKFLTDKKIPADKKAELFLVAKDNKVYIICGVEISAEVKIKENSKKIFKLTCLKL